MSVSGADGRPGEFDLIARYFRPLAHPDYALMLADDAALMSLDGATDLVLTADTLIAGVHFFADDPPAEIAAKALRVNLSDLAAKAATPIGYLMSLGLADDWREDWVAEFCRGLGEDQEAFQFQLLGGDTVRSPERLMISITAIGRAGEGGMVRRTGAQEGDNVFVTGTIGDAALGLAVLQAVAGERPWPLAEQHSDFLVGRYRRPQPRLAAAPVLRRHARAAMDISDGLVGDLEKMTGAGVTGARIELADIPLSQAAHAAADHCSDFHKTVLTGGDDYELLVAVPDKSSEIFFAEMADAGLPVARIGRFEAATTGVEIVSGDGSVLEFTNGAYRHF